MQINTWQSMYGVLKKYLFKVQLKTSVWGGEAMYSELLEIVITIAVNPNYNTGFCGIVIALLAK